MKLRSRDPVGAEVVELLTGRLGPMHTRNPVWCDQHLRRAVPEHRPAVLFAHVTEKGYKSPTGVYLCGDCETLGRTNGPYSILWVVRRIGASV